MAKLDTDLGGEIVSFDIPDRISSAFDIEAFDEAIQSHGVRFVHYRGMRNPVGLTDRFDSRRTEDDHSGASNGLIYTKAGCIAALFTGNSKDIRAMEAGMLDAGTAQITVARNYVETTEPIYLHPMDRLYLEEESVLVTHQQLVESHETGDDRLRFPAVQVLDLVDSRNIRYTQNVEFKVEDGRIHWCSPNRPGIDPVTGKGRVYAVRYLMRPFWYVDRMLHEVRVAQFEHPLTGSRGTARMPQSAIIQREYVYQNEDKDDQAPNPASPRQVNGPRSGGFGPR